MKVDILMDGCDVSIPDSSPQSQMLAVFKFFLSRLFVSDALTTCTRCILMTPIEQMWLEVSIPPRERALVWIVGCCGRKMEGQKWGPKISLFDLFLSNLMELKLLTYFMLSLTKMRLP